MPFPFRHLAVLGFFSVAALAAQEIAPRVVGDEVLLRERLAKYQEAATGTPKDERLAREIAQRLLDVDWSRIDVSAVALKYCMEQEQAHRDGKAPGWRFEALPPTLPRLAPPLRWLSTIDRALSEVLEDMGDLSTKRTNSRKKQTEDASRCRALPILSFCVAWDLNLRLQILPKDTLEQFQVCFRRAWKDFELGTPQKTSSYENLPSGIYLRFSAWLGDPEAFKRIDRLCREWLAAPRSEAEANIVEVVHALTALATLHLGQAIEASRGELVTMLRARHDLPTPVQEILKRYK